MYCTFKDNYIIDGRAFVTVVFGLFWNDIFADLRQFFSFKENKSFPYQYPNE